MHFEICSSQPMAAVAFPQAQIPTASDYTSRIQYCANKKHKSFKEKDYPLLSPTSNASRGMSIYGHRIRMTLVKTWLSYLTELNNFGQDSVCGWLPGGEQGRQSIDGERCGQNKKRGKPWAVVEKELSCASAVHQNPVGCLFCDLSFKRFFPFPSSIGNGHQPLQSHKGSKWFNFMGQRDETNNQTNMGHI